ncbi:MAG: M61 family peptidase, partial [Moraxellaceae bacterium]
MIQYTLSFAQYHQHLIKVQLRFFAQPQQQLWLPTWIPGSYLIREFARHIEAVTAQTCQHHESIAIRKISKNQWQLSNQQPVELEISYLVYAYDLSVRGAYVDSERLYINPAAVCLAVAGQEEQAIDIRLNVPPELSHFTLASSLQRQASSLLNSDDLHDKSLQNSSLQKGSLQKSASQNQASNTQNYSLNAAHYYDLIDQPLELAKQAIGSFKVKDIVHQVAISGQHQTDLTRLCADLSRICSAQIALFGSAPFADYVFMVMATANSYGGLEHQRSTSLITPRDDLPKTTEPEKPSAGYQRFLGLCSHEYFHSWLVKFIRPANYVRPDLHQEDYTSLLWVFEGITSYYDDLMLYRSGVIDQTAYIDLVKDQFSRYLGNPGRHIQSVAES